MSKVPFDAAGFPTSREYKEFGDDIAPHLSDAGYSSERTLTDDEIAAYPSDSDDSSERTLSDGESDSRFDSERTNSASYGHMRTAPDGDYFEADSGHLKARDQELYSAAKKEKHLVQNMVNGQQDYLKADSGSFKARSSVVQPEGAQVKDRKQMLQIPKWLNQYEAKINIDKDGWQHWQIDRKDSRVADKYYSHRDYTYTFRSKPEVTHFLDTGEVKGKVLLKKRRSTYPSGHASGSSRSTRRRMPQVPGTPSNLPQDPGISSYRRPTIGGMFRYSTRLPHGFL
ncbi:hypothetical protein ACP4OV_009021 [Aristida adscensionis]